MLLKLVRETLSPATIGRLSIDGVPECDSLELPWKGNERGISCVPPGTYRIWDVESPRFGRPMLRLMGVPKRRGILIHIANFIRQLAGCIALGTRLGPDSLMESKVAVERVEAKVRAALARGESVTLEIVNPGEAG